MRATTFADDSDVEVATGFCVCSTFVRRQSSRWGREVLDYQIPKIPKLFVCPGGRIFNGKRSKAQISAVIDSVEFMTEVGLEEI